MSFKTLGRDLLHFLFPPVCQHCGTYQEDPDGPGALCPSCLNEIPGQNGGRCRTCGLYKGPYARPVPSCKNCSSIDFSFERTIVLGNYQSPLRDWIHEMKFQRTPSLAYSLGRALGRQLQKSPQDMEPDVLCPVPMNPIREIQRSFNQTLCIAKGLQSIVSLPIHRQLRKTKRTRPQVDLSREERLTNLQNAFSVHHPGLFQDQTVLLVDDVMTTGGTADACSTTLINQGEAKAVCVAVLAR